MSERRPYRLVRGYYARREGDTSALRDNETGAKTKAKAPPYVHYQAQTVENPRARNEIMLNDREAEALKGRVVPLFRVDVRTGKETPYDPQAKVKVKSMDELIAIGMAVSGTKSLNDFRAEVLKSGYLSHLRTIPSRKHDVLAALRKVQQETASSASPDAEDGPDAEDDQD